MKKIIALILAYFLTTLTACGSNGISETPPRETRSAEQIVSHNTTIGENETLVVEANGTLVISEGAVLTVNGTLKCAAGGSIKVLGDIVAEGSIELSGTLSVEESGTVSGGTLTVLNSFEAINCKGSVTSEIIPPEPVTENGVTTIGGILLVNKIYSLPEDYGGELDGNAYAAWVKMKEETGYDFTMLSGYRSYQRQQELFDYWVEQYGYEAALMESALPGKSEHQSGLAMDVGRLEYDYAYTDEGIWLTENCYKYGFIIRYPEEKTEITGYIYEPWHIRYLGESTAKLVHDSGLTLEEFLKVYKQ